MTTTPLSHAAPRVVRFAKFLTPTRTRSFGLRLAAMAFFAFATSSTVTRADETCSSPCLPRIEGQEAP